MSLIKNLWRRLSERKELPLYAILFVLISAPIFNSDLFRGHDIYFHLMRIEGLAEGLKTGQFPVKIQPGWFEGYGYAVSVFYGDLLLHFSAFLHLLGMSLQNAYKAYVLMCNLGTIGIAGYSFTKIFANRYIGVFGSALYCFSVYRLMNVYVRASLGEYTGMMLLPLVAYACVLLFNREHNKTQIRKGTYILSISMALIVQSHILTCEMVCLMLVFVLLLNIRQVFCKEVLIGGLKAVVIALGLSLGFLVPFVDYMLSMKLQVNSGGDSMSSQIQRQGAFWKQHVEVFNSTQGASLDISAGTEGEFSIGIGLVLTLAIVAFIIMAILIRNKDGKREWRIATVSFVLGILALWMTTYKFPWNRLAGYAGPFESIIASIQFPWRFSSMAALCMILVWCAVVKIIYEHNQGKISIIVSGAVIALSMFSAVCFFVDLYTYRERIHIDSIEDMDTYVWSGNEYLATNVDLENLKERPLFEGENLQINDYSINGINIALNCENEATTAQTLKVPLLFYKGYQAVGKYNDGITCDIPVCAGDDGVVQLAIPADSSLDVQVRFAEPLMWRIAEILSLLTVIGLSVQGYSRLRKNDKNLQK